MTRNGIEAATKEEFRQIKSLIRKIYREGSKDTVKQKAKEKQVCMNKIKEFDDTINRLSYELRMKDARLKFLIETEKEKEGYIRLSIDEEMWNIYGQRGIDYSENQYDELSETKGHMGYLQTLSLYKKNMKQR